jgi:hypothetical protein
VAQPYRRDSRDRVGTVACGRAGDVGNR